MNLSPSKLHHLLFAMTASVYAVILFLSLKTLSSFPPVNLDEADNSVMADSWVHTGEIRFSLDDNAIDPHYEGLAASNQGSLRGLYTALLGNYQRITGRNFSSLRCLSFLIWGINGWLMFFIIKKRVGLAEAMVALLLWTILFEGIVASHLIRPDIFLPLFVTGLIGLATGDKKSKKLNLFLSGFLAAAVLGFHPNGMAFIPVGILWVVLDRENRTLKNFSHWGLGILSGFMLFALSADWPTYEISKHTYNMDLYRMNAHVWLDRLNPFHLLPDSLGLLIHPHSFYVHDVDWVLKKVAAVATCGMVLASLTWSFNRMRAHPFLKACWVGSLGFFFAIGYRHMREEMLYNLPLLVCCLPLAAEVLCENIRIDNWGYCSRFKILFIGGCVCVMSAASLGSLWRSYKMSAPLEQTFIRSRELIKSPKERIMGPLFFWFEYGENMRDNNVLLADYLYSGQLRAPTIFKRWHPRYLIVDDEFRKRFLGIKTQGQTADIERRLKFLIPSSFQKIGSLLPTHHHSALEVYELQWQGTSGTPERVSN